jgi:hypothetical protein
LQFCPEFRLIHIVKVVALGFKKFGFGGGGGGGGGDEGNAAVVPAQEPAAESGGSGSSQAPPPIKLLPLHATLCFPFHPEDNNTPITGIVPLPQSHYACVSSTSGQIRMWVDVW